MFTDDLLIQQLKQMNIRLEVIKLSTLKQQMCIDDIFTFTYNDNIIKFYLPTCLYDFIEKVILSTGTFYELPLLRKAQKFISKESTIADIGANIGNHTVFFSKILKCKQVYAFEPMQTSYNILQKNLDINHINNCETFNHLLGEREDNSEILVSPPSNRGGTTFIQSSKGSYKIIPLDSIGLPKLDFIKIDVEGMQMSVLSGAKDTIMEYKPTLWIELGTPEEQNEATNLLKSWGYGDPVELRHSDWLFPGKTNIG